MSNPYVTTYTQFTHPSGFRWIHARQPWAKTFAAELSFRAGWLEEPAADAGITHLMEHLLFRVNERRERELSRGGLNLNGATDVERTSFSAGGRSSDLPQAIEFLLSMMARQEILTEHIEQELNVLRHEMALHGETPYDIQRRRIIGGIVGDRRYKRPPKMKFRRLARKSPEDLARFHGRWFGPSNGSLVVVSNSAPEIITELIDSALGAAALARTLEDSTPSPIPPISQLVMKPLEMPATTVMVLYYYRPLNLFPLTAIAMLADALAGGSHSYFFERLRQREQMGYAVNGGFWRLCDASILAFEAVVGRRHAFSALREMNDIIEDVRERSLSAEEFDFARRRLIGRFDGLEDHPATLVQFLAGESFYASGDEPVTPECYRREINGLTSETFSEISTEIFKPERRVTAILGPLDPFVRWRVRRLEKARVR